MQVRILLLPKPKTSFYNERQRVEIDLVKSLETDEATVLAITAKSLM